MKEWSQRFAERLLKDNLQLEEFQVSLIGYDKFEEIVDWLKALGCKVHVDPIQRRLIVTCPQPGSSGHRGHQDHAPTHQNLAHQDSSSSMSGDDCRESAKAKSSSLSPMEILSAMLDGTFTEKAPALVLNPCS